ncbi:hypothetical protein AVEN_183836-1 [Araneus ventricosus]|uniref:Uncharacterized protein n=1 Tax=Araneus ventricosus TaxID=182803 RepID=A0A4Y2AZF4_ARAVE|nr:hypothetical protein AVEN_183836-1 [Araneus ventricosus]
MDSEDFPTLIESSEPGTSKSVMRKDFITPMLVASLDRCELSMRDSVFILEATIDALGCNIDEFPIMTLHWDGKLLPALSAQKSKEERFPIVISYGLKEQLIAVPKLDNSTKNRRRLFGRRS